MMESAELQPTNPSVEVIIKSLLKAQTRPSTLELSSAAISKLPTFSITITSAHEADHIFTLNIPYSHISTKINEDVLVNMTNMEGCFLCLRSNE